MTYVERRVRIGDWLVPYDDASQDVVLHRTLADVLHAQPGVDTDCMNTRCIQAQRNAHVFPHHVYLVSTIKSRVYIVDRLDDAGLPAHALRYELTRRDSALIGAHDRYGAGEVGELKLRVPRDPKGSPKRAAYGSRFADGEGRFSGDGKASRQARPVTNGARARYMVAVGALRAQDGDAT
jgi:hypothetical protein